MTESDNKKGKQLLIIFIIFSIVCIICSELMGGRWESDDEGFKRLRRAARLELD